MLACFHMDTTTRRGRFRIKMPLRSLLKEWGGKPENKQKAQEMLRAICQVNGLAQMGKYTGEIAERGHPSTTGSLYEKGYQY